MARNDSTDEWVERYADKLVRFAAIYTHDAALAPDIAQETFLELYRLEQRKGLRDLHPGWLYRVAQNKVRDYARRGMLSGRAMPPATGGASEEWETRVLVQDAMQHLSAIDQECLWLFYYLDLPIADIARLLGKEEKSVRGRLFRARRRFARVWGEDV